MADYLIIEVKAAQTIGEKTIPATYELTLLQDAVNEAGQAVKIRGQKMNITESQVDQRISQLEGDLAKWKSIKAELEK